MSMSTCSSILSFIVLLGSTSAAERFEVTKFLGGDLVRMTPNWLTQARFLHLRRSPPPPSSLVPSTSMFEATSSPSMGSVANSVFDDGDDVESHSFSVREPIAPRVVCDDGEIGIELGRRFSGRIFVRRKHDEPECIRVFTTNSVPRFSTRLSGVCDVTKRYRGIPSKVVEYNVRLVVSHEEDSVTELDRIYDVTCSYSIFNATLTAYYDTTTFDPLPMDEVRPLPKCRYSLHRNSPDGPKTLVARVGDVVFHRWKCSSPDYTFKVYGCTVSDGNDKDFLIVDEHGCSLDEDIIPHPEYDSANNIVSVPAKAFRFANTRRVHFKCLLAVCPKFDARCTQNIPPKCRKSLSKRQLKAVGGTVEDRLWRIHSLLNKNQTRVGQIVEQERPASLAGTASLELTAGELVVGSESSDIKRERVGCSQLDEVVLTYRLWILAVCVANVLLTAVSIVACIRLVKNKYAMDIENPKRSFFYRIPF